MSINKQSTLFQFSPVMLVAALVLLACLVYLAQALLSDKATSAVSKRAGGYSVQQTEAVMADRDIAEPPGLVIQAAIIDKAIPADTIGGVQPELSTVRFSHRQSGAELRQQSVPPAAPLNAGNAVNTQTRLQENVQSIPVAITGLVDSSAVGAGQAAGLAVDTPPVNSRQISEVSATADNDTRGTIPGDVYEDTGLFNNSGGYTEVTAEVQIDLDEKQIIRCYPVGGDSGLPCMCEFTLIKEGRTQTDVVDNCQ